MKFTILVCGALATAALLAPRGARASGAIDDDGASIVSGLAPTRGTVLVDPCATPVTPPTLPPVGSIGSMGTMPGAIPAFPGGGGGAAFVAGQSMTLAGGVYSYTTYNVAPGMTVTYLGAVTIQTTGDVQIDGLVTTATPGSSITFVCGGNLRVLSHNGPVTTGIATTGLASPVVLDVLGSVTVSSADASVGQIDAASGNVLVTARANPAVLAIGGVVVRSRSGGNVNVASASGIGLLGGTLQADVGAVTCQSFGADTAVNGGTILAATGASIDSAAGILVTNTSSVTAQGPVALAAYGGDLRIVGGRVAQTGGTGDVTLRAAEDVLFSGATLVENLGTGSVAATAFGGDVSLEAAGSKGASVVHALLGGNVDASASGEVIVGGTGELRADQGGVNVRAAGGVQVLGTAAVRAPQGALDLRTGGAFTVDDDPIAPSGAFPTLAGNSILARAGADGLSIAGVLLVSQAGPMSLVADGPVTVATSVTANGSLTIQSLDAGIDVAGRTLATGDAGARSGDIVIESFAGVGGAIDASGATIRSGDHATRSGDVTLLVHAPGGSDVSGAIVVRSASLKSKPKGAPPRLLVEGFLDTGREPADLTGAARLTAGTYGRDILLSADARGRATYEDETLTLRITPSKRGTSRAAFSLSFEEDFGGLLDAQGNGSVALQFERGDLEAVGAVRLTRGSFSAKGRPRGRVAPQFFVDAAHAVVKPGAEDKLDLVAAFGTDGDAPASAPSVSVAFGPSFAVDVPASAFSSRGARFQARDLAQGVKLLAVDYAARTVTLRARKVDLGDFGPGLTVPVDCAVTIDGKTWTFRFRMAHRGSALLY